LLSERYEQSSASELLLIGPGNVGPYEVGPPPRENVMTFSLLLAARNARS